MTDTSEVPETLIAAASNGRARRKPVPVADLFPRMDYYEFDSVEADARYAIWVTTPAAYDKDADRHFPAIYTPDGNWFAPGAAHLSALGQMDMMDPFEDTIQICIGYIGKEAEMAFAIRCRDLLPPMEPLLPGAEAMLAGMVAAGMMDQAGADLYGHWLRHPAADRFLAFITNELHPFIQKRYRIRTEDLGLFGVSYSGLFTTYAALQKTTIFRNIGAASPGILVKDSSIFGLYSDALANGGIDDRNLHLTVATREIAESPVYQMMIGAGSVEFMRLARSTPLEGLNLTTELQEKESHMTVAWPARHSFMRRFYLRKA